MKRLSTWLIIIGLITMAVPAAGKCYMYYEQQKMYDAFLKEQALAKEQAELMTEAFDDDISAQAAETDKPQQIKGVIGRIEIPKISSDLLLLEGSSSRELRYGAGHLTGTAMPGDVGNCAVAAHRNYTFGTYFNRLDEVENGDTITITYNGSVTVYTVFNSLTVLPSDISVLEQPADDTILTLITCTPRGSNTHRLIVQARLQ